ncbi:MAG: lipoprotein-releasing system permease protein, partial [Myxococcota bacterium]
ENDLRGKILSTNPHVVIADDSPMEGISDFHNVLSQLTELEGVMDAIPYVQGDVIITSRENRNVSLTLRGIDPADIVESDHHLQGGLVSGDIGNLLKPERLVPSARWLLRQSPRGILEEATESGPAPQPEATKPSNPEPNPIEPTPIEPTPINGVIEPTLIPGVDDQSDVPLDEGIRPTILLGQELATSLRVDVGSEVTVVSPQDGAGFLGVQPRARTFRVAGVFHTGMYEFDLKLAYIAISEAQRFFHLGPDINRIELRLSDVDRSDEVVAQIVPIIAHQSSLTAIDWKHLNKNLFSALQLEKIVMFVVLGFIIFVASLNVIGSLAMIIIEKSREIAILKSMGAARREIFGTFMFLGTVIGAIGSAAGLGVGLLTCWFIQYVGIQLPRQYYIDKLPVHIDPMTVTTVFLAGIALCVIATIYPALEAERIEPVEGLRND